MATVFDWLAASLFVATAAMYFVRLRHERPPLAPYAVIFLACFAGNWLGDVAHPAVAVGILIAGAFLLLHIASLPYPEEGEDGARR
jgi:hypothetical protein